MLRILMTTAILGTAGLTFAMAQNAAPAFEKLMKEQSAAAYHDLNGMVKGELPFDKAKADQAIDKLTETSHKIVDTFAPSLKGQKSAESRYIASPKIWENPADFKAKADALAKVVAESRGKVETLDALKATYPKINDACNSCHDVYRQRAS